MLPQAMQGHHCTAQQSEFVRMRATAAFARLGRGYFHVPSKLVVSGCVDYGVNRQVGTQRRLHIAQQKPDRSFLEEDVQSMSHARREQRLHEHEDDQVARIDMQMLHGQLRRQQEDGEQAPDA
jgi:hypothetical protein